MRAAYRLRTVGAGRRGCTRVTETGKRSGRADGRGEAICLCVMLSPLCVQIPQPMDCGLHFQQCAPRDYVSFTTFPPQAHSASLRPYDCRQTNPSHTRCCTAQIAQCGDLGARSESQVFPGASRTYPGRISFRCRGRAFAHLQDRTRTHQSVAADACYAVLLPENHIARVVRRHQGNLSAFVERRRIAPFQSSSSRCADEDKVASRQCLETRNVMNPAPGAPSTPVSSN